MRPLKVAALALAVVFLASLLDAQAPLASPEIPVSTGREFPMFPHVAMAANGDFAVVWESRGASASSPSRLWVRRFAANGKAKGRDVLVSRPKGAGTHQTDPRIAMTPGGGFMIVWESGNIIQHSVVFGRSFAADGRPLGPAFQLNAGDPARLQFSPDVAAAPDGSFLATWASGYNPFGHLTDIFVRRFDTDGAPLGPAFKVITRTAVWQDHPRVAVSGNGDFLVGWLGAPDIGSRYALTARRFDAGDRPLGDPFRVSSEPGIPGDDNEFTLLMKENGESLFLWIDAVPDASPSEGFIRYGILGQRFTAADRPDGSLFVVQETRMEVQEPPVAALLPGGGYFVAWRNPLFPSTVFGRRLSDVGLPQGPELRINLLGAAYHPALAVAPNGRGVVTWTASVKRKSGVVARLLAF